MPKVNPWFDRREETRTIMQITKFVRKPFEVEGTRVTAENIQEVAAWCQSEVRVTKGKGGTDDVPFVKVRVLRPLNERQTMAYLGDWILYAGTGYKVYTNKAFMATFEPAEGNYSQVLEPKPEDEGLAVFKELATQQHAVI
jgi:hypothetical protein